MKVVMDDGVPATVDFISVEVRDLLRELGELPTRLLINLYIYL